MRCEYCPRCGTKAIQKEIGDEGLMPYCDTCQKPLWDIITTCIIAAVVNECGEIALIRQSYVSPTKYVCVAGVMKAGEAAEETAVREIKEELGLDTQSLTFVRSYPYEEKGLLMLGFKATVKKADFVLSKEVDDAEWVSLDNALSLIRNGSIAHRLVSEVAANL